MLIDFTRAKISDLCRTNPRAKEAFDRTAECFLKNSRFSTTRSVTTVFRELIKQVSLPSSHTYSFQYVMQGRFQDATTAFKIESLALIKKISLVAFGIFFISLGLLSPYKVYTKFPSETSTSEGESQRPTIPDVNPLPVPPSLQSSTSHKEEDSNQNESQKSGPIARSSGSVSHSQAWTLNISLPLPAQTLLIDATHAAVGQVLSSPKNSNSPNWIGVKFQREKEQQILWMNLSDPSVLSSLHNLLHYTKSHKQKTESTSHPLIQSKRQSKKPKPDNSKVKSIDSVQSLIEPIERVVDRVEPPTNNNNLQETDRLIIIEDHLGATEVSTFSDKKFDKLEEDFVLVSPTKDSIETFFVEYTNQCLKVGSPSRYRLEDVRALIAKGRLLLQKIQGGSAQEDIPLQERRSWLSSFVWVLMLHAHRKRQSFVQGMFDFPDPHHRIITFFESTAILRASSHYKQKREDALGIDVVQDYKTGLPGNHQTVLFGRFEDPKGDQARSYLKPENWGVETWGQLWGHGIDYGWTRLYNPELEDDRKEHCPAEVIAAFSSLYTELTQKASVPKEICNITAMVRFLMNYPDNEKLESIKNFILSLEEWYPDIANMNRTGNEVCLTDSFLGGAPLKAEPSEQSIAYLLFKAFLHLKTAQSQKEIQAALASLMSMNEKMKWEPHPTMIKDNIAVYNRKEPGKKAAILHQVGLDLERSQGQEVFIVNGERFTGDAQQLLDLLLDYYSQNEDQALNAMTLMQQGIKEAMMTEMIRCLASPIPGLQITTYAAPNENLAEVKVKIDPTTGILIEIWQKYGLRAIDCEKESTFRSAPYAVVKGFTRIELSKESAAKAYIRWAIDSLNP